MARSVVCCRRESQRNQRGLRFGEAQPASEARRVNRIDVAGVLVMASGHVAFTIASGREIR